jgi:hypothetical protein
VLVWALPGSAAERRIVIGSDGRMSLATAAARSHLTAEALESRHAATGVVECGGMRGIGQLTGRADVVSSAAHVFFDEAGRSRAAAGRCVFRLTTAAGVEEIPLVPDPRACGATDPYAHDGRHDWAFARLVRPAVGVRPYPFGPSPRVGDQIAVVAVEGGEKTIDLCRVREVHAGPGGDREIRTDCTGFDGMSGAGYLTTGERPRLVGLHVGFRSRHPDRPGPFAEDHHTFGATLAGTAMRAVSASAK